MGVLRANDWIANCKAEQDAGEEPPLAVLLRRFFIVVSWLASAEWRSQSGPSAQSFGLLTSLPVNLHSVASWSCGQSLARLTMRALIIIGSVHGPGPSGTVIAPS